MQTENPVYRPDGNSVAIFVDFENIEISYEHKSNSDSEVDWSKVLDIAVQYGRPAVRRAYADWSKYVDNQRELLRLGFQLINVPSKGHGKNAADIQMTIDILDMFIMRDSKINYILLMSGDGDFTPLAHYLKEHDRHVIGVGISGTSAEYLINACDKYEYFDLIEKPKAQSTDSEEPTAEKPVGFDVSEARKLLRRVMQPVEEGYVEGGVVKKQMCLFNPDFDERNFGFASFKKFLEEQSDIVDVRHNPTSNSLEVGPPLAADPSPAPLLPEAKVDEYLRILSENRISMTPTEQRPDIIRKCFELFKNLEGHSYNQIKEEIFRFFGEHLQDIKEGYVRDCVHQVYKAGCLQFDPKDKNYHPSVTLWNKRLWLKKDIQSADDLLQRVDRFLLNILYRNVLPVGAVDTKAASRVLYGNYKNQMMVNRLLNPPGK
jgi:uncharacterized LabA/DUF88 family protein